MMNDIILSWAIFQIILWIGGFVIFIIMNPDKHKEMKTRILGWILVTGTLGGWLSFFWMIGVILLL